MPGGATRRPPRRSAPYTEVVLLRLDVVREHHVVLFVLQDVAVPCDSDTQAARLYLADFEGELRPGELGAEVFLPPVERPRAHISVGVEFKDAVPGKDGPEQAGDDEAIGGDSD
jgi:hypothetical protein